ncbi:MAG: ATP phosphoribosyltransferase [Rhodobacteraceae bacterium]|nr:ATP phosphoribosyltransferase [Paracoccaceae bacterium]
MLSFAIPSKGRLAEQSASWLAGHGIEIVKSDSDRRYSGSLTGALEAELLFLSASEIPVELERGNLHLAITGMDVLRERMPEWRRHVTEIAPLGFGHADLAICVPKFWIDAESVDDLDAIAARFRRHHGRRLRIATKYPQLARGFLSRNGVADYQLVFSRGATEGTVANNNAEAIADLVSTGRTLDANGLKKLPGGTILQSEAALFLSAAEIPENSQDAVKRFIRRARAAFK